MPWSQLVLVFIWHVLTRNCIVWHVPSQWFYTPSFCMCLSNANTCFLVLCGIYSLLGIKACSLSCTVLLVSVLWYVILVFVHYYCFKCQCNSFLFFFLVRLKNFTSHLTCLLHTLLTNTANHILRCNCERKHILTYNRTLQPELSCKSAHLMELSVEEKDAHKWLQNLTAKASQLLTRDANIDYFFRKNMYLGILHLVHQVWDWSPREHLFAINVSLVRGRVYPGCHYRERVSQGSS